MKGRYAVYLSLLGTPNRTLVSRHRWLWVSRLWAAECRRVFLPFTFEVIDEGKGRDLTSF